MKIKLVSLWAILLAASCSGAVTYYQNVDIGNYNSLGPNSIAAQAAWAAAVSQLATFNMESASGASGAGTVTGPLQTVSSIILSVSSCTGCGTGSPTLTGIVPNSAAADKAEVGYATSGTQLYQVLATLSGATFSNTAVTFNFSQSVSAFGVYVTGVQTALGTTVVTFNDGSAQTTNLLNSGTVVGQPAGSQFLGIISTTGSFSSITFTTTQAHPTTGRDVIGFDDFTLGNFNNGVAEPGTLGTLSMALVGLAGYAWRRKRS